MIKTVGELLTELLEREKAVLRQIKDVKQGPMIGDMYEGLTRTVLDRAIFEELDIRVAEGAIRNDRGDISRQLDCMIVRGAGEQLPHTNHFIYPVDRVIGIVEVMKTLYAGELVEGAGLFTDYFRRVAEPHTMPRRLVADAWRSIMRSALPQSNEEARNLTFEDEMIYHSLMVDANLPMRIVFGYDGYTTESGLRRGFVRYLEGLQETGASGGSPVAFPSLIVSGDKFLVKLNGMPYGTPLDRDGFWAVIGSRGTRVVYALLELLWTRISYLFDLSTNLFGEDLELEGVNRLLRTKAAKIGERIGWKYIFDEGTEAELSALPDTKDWNPEQLSLPEFEIIRKLCEGQVIEVNADLMGFVRGHNITVDDLVQSLRSKGLAYRRAATIELLPVECVCFALPDGRFFAGENKSGRVTRWIERYR